MKPAKSLIYYNLVREFEKNKLLNNAVADQVGIKHSAFSLKMSGHNEFKLNEMLKIQNLVNGMSSEHYTLDYLFEKE